MVPNLQLRIDETWPLIQEVVEHVLGKAEARTPRKLVRVEDVDASIRVLLGKSSHARVERPLGGGELVDVRYKAETIALSHRRYSFDLTTEELETLALTPPQDKDVRARLRAWSGAVLVHEAKVVVDPLVAGAAGVVPGPIDRDCIAAARDQMSEHGHPCAHGPLTLVVEDGRLTADEKDEGYKAVLHGLGGGKVVRLPAATRLRDDALGVVFDPGPQPLVTYQAVELALGWDATGNGVRLLLDQRSSDVYGVPAPGARVRIQA